MKTQKQSFGKLGDIFCLFLAGAVIGWLYEVILHAVTVGMLVNRGMLYGPWLPIYGMGCILMVVLKKWVGNKPGRYFMACVAVSGALEYATSWLMETIYHKRWWDYSEFPLNLHGRIFAGGLVGFGVAGCLFAYLALPAIEKKYRAVPGYVRKGFVIALAAVFVLDVFVSLFFPNVGIGVTNE